MAQMVVRWAQTHKPGQNQKETPILLNAVTCLLEYTYLLDVFTDNTTWPLQKYTSSTVVKGLHSSGNKKVQSIYA